MNEPPTDPRRTVRRSRRWTNLSRTLRAQAGRCAACGDPRSAADLTVDHIEPLAARPDLAYEPSNLRVLCRDCHAELDDAYPDPDRRRRRR